MSPVGFERLTSLPVHVAVLDANGIIVAVNDGWRRFGRSNGLQQPADGIGTDYVASGTPSPSAAGMALNLADELRRLLRGELGLLTYAYACATPKRKLWFVLIGMPLAAPEPRGAVMIHVDISDLMVSDAVLQNLGVVDDGSRDDERGAPSMQDQIAAAIERSLQRAIPLLISGMASARVGADQQAQEERDTARRVRQHLTPRQSQVLSLLAEGRSNAEIAERLRTSPHTVKLHVAAILKRLALANRAQAVALAARLPRDEHSPAGT
jgi:DNA-binding CsgD family transcriptional regulator